MKNLKLKFKRAYKSWTIRFNAAAALFVEFIPFAAQHFSELESVLPPGPYINILRALLIANLLLRFKTEASLADR